MERTTVLIIVAGLLVACGGGEIGGSGMLQADSGPGWTPQADGAPPYGGEDSASATPSNDPGKWKGNGPEKCGDGLDNDGDGKVDENCPCTANSGATQGCYPGDPATRNIGLCVDGNQSCITSGEFATWDQCTGARLPVKEICWDKKDNDCNGKVDDAPYCVCQVGQTKACYSGPAATKNVGRCKEGKQQCNAAGSAWLKACVGQVLPGKEICNNNIDDDCDGQTDEGCLSPIKPVSCTTATLKHVTGGADCGSNRAVYMVDDGSGPNMVCCTLPATDILTGSITVRYGQCSTNEVIVGATAKTPSSARASTPSATTWARPPSPATSAAAPPAARACPAAPATPTPLPCCKRTSSAATAARATPTGRCSSGRPARSARTCWRGSCASPARWPPTRPTPR